MSFWGTERRADAVTRIVVPELHCHGPLHHGADPVAHAPRRLRPEVPDPPERLDHVGARHVTDGNLADVREREPRETRLPVVGVPRTAPAGPHVGPDPFGGVGERGPAPGAALVGEGIASGAGELAVGERLLAGFLERDERETAESEFAASAADGDPLHPASAARRPDIEVQAMSIAVASGLGDVSDEGGGEGVFGLPALGLGFLGSSRVHGVHRYFRR